MGCKLLFGVMSAVSCLALTGCFPPITDADPAPIPTKPAAVRRIEVPVFGGAKPSASSGDFYYAIATEPDRLIDSRDCVDTSAMAWFRKTYDKEAAEATIVASMAPDGGNRVRIPLFVVGKAENPGSGSPNCYSTTLSGQLTPWYRADADSSSTVQFEVGTANRRDFSGIQRVLSAVRDVLSFAGSSSFIVSKLTQSQFDHAATNVAESITNNLSVSTLDTLTYDFRPFAIVNSSEGLEFSIPNIEASSGGVALTQARISALRLGLIYTSSLFTGPDGRYPTDFTQVITKNFTPRLIGRNSSLRVLLSEGIGGVSLSGLQRLDTKANIESSCRELQLALSEGFSSKDALVAKYAIIRQYVPQALLNPNFTSDECFNTAQKAILESVGYRVADAEATETGRNRTIDQRLAPLVKALRSGDADGLDKMLLNDKGRVRFSIFPGLDNIPDYHVSGQSWNSQGPEAVQRMLEFGKKSRIACYQASPGGSLQQLGAVALFGDQSVGVLFYFSEEGKLEQVLLASIDSARQIGGLGNAYPTTNCSLL